MYGANIVSKNEKSYCHRIKKVISFIPQSTFSPLDDSKM